LWISRGPPSSSRRRRTSGGWERREWKEKGCAIEVEGGVGGTKSAIKVESRRVQE